MLHWVNNPCASQVPTWNDFLTAAIEQARDLSKGRDAATYGRSVRLLNAVMRAGGAPHCRDVLETAVHACGRECDGLAPLILSAYDCLVVSGHREFARLPLQKLPVQPRFSARDAARLPLAPFSTSSGAVVDRIDPEVAILFMSFAAARAREGAPMPQIATLAEQPDIARALCSFPLYRSDLGELTRSSILRQASCLLEGQPTMDVNRLCEKAEQGAVELGELGRAEMARLRELCQGLLPTGSTAAAAVPGLGNVAIDACVDEQLVAVEAQAGFPVDGSLSTLIAECSGVGTPRDSTVPRRRRGPFVSFKCGGEWECKFDTEDDRSNRANSARAGEPGFIAVWALADGAVEVVATTKDGKIGIFIFEPETIEDDLDFFALKANEVATKQALEEAARRAQGGDEPVVVQPASDDDDSEDEDNSGGESDDDDAGSEDDESEASGGEAGGSEMDPEWPFSTDGEACRKLTALLKIGRDGRSHDPFALLRTGGIVDPRAVLPPRYAEANAPSSPYCGTAEVGAIDHSCGPVLCDWPLVLDDQCTCRRADPGEQPMSGGCSAVLCQEGTLPVAAGVGCVCSNSEGDEPAFPPPGLDPVGDPSSAERVLSVRGRLFADVRYESATIPGRTCGDQGCVRSVHFRGGSSMRGQAPH
jgi:hypothetical protein